MVGSPDAIGALVEPVLVSSGLELWDVEVSRDTVRLLVDRPGGVDLDALATLAGKVVSPLLDEHPELTPEGRFSLEVSSPGVERTLRTLDHYARYVGTEISVKTSVPVEGSRRHQGILVSVDDDGIVVQPHDGPAGGTVAIRHADIDRARTVLVWGPAEKPGGKKGKHQQKPGSTKAVKRPAANGRDTAAAQPVASREKDTE
ncbi:MAG TPA: ribosome maturation factor RimP [Acidimicrobiales bacterium]|nr:ribosome maturation factor RimP [Acidimicrobiales bacterium]